MKQTKLHSLIESLNAAAFAAPTALLLHRFVLEAGGECVLVAMDCNGMFLGVSWVLFFAHSVAWKYIVRRIHERYGVQLDPYHMVLSLKRRLFK